MQLVRYTRYWFPGSFVSEDSIRPYAEPTPEHAYAAQDFARYETLDPRGGVMTSKAYDHGPKRIMGTIYTLEDVKKLSGNYGILIGNMECNGWDRVVKCAQGFLPLDKDDVVVEWL